MKYQIFNNKFHKYFYSLSVFITGLFLFANKVYAQTCNIRGAAGTPNTVANLVCSITRTINIFLILGGVIFSLVIIMGAYKYFTSMGDPKGIMGARNTLTYGIAGFLIVTASMAIVVLIGNILGIDIGNPSASLRSGICDLLKNIADQDIVQGPCG